MPLCIYMYSQTLNSPLTSSSYNKGHDALEGVKKNIPTNQPTNL